MNRGRPKKQFDDQLIERVGTRLRPKDRERLDKIADITGIAPEIHLRAAILDYMRRKEGDEAILQAI